MTRYDRLKGHSIKVQMQKKTNINIKRKNIIAYTSAGEVPGLGQFGHLTESWIDRLSGFAQNLDEIPSVFHVVSREEGVSRSSLSSATGATDAMYVVLRRRRIIKINHVLNVVDI